MLVDPVPGDPPRGAALADRGDDGGSPSASSRCARGLPLGCRRSRALRRPRPSRTIDRPVVRVRRPHRSPCAPSRRSTGSGSLPAGHPDPATMGRAARYDPRARRRSEAPTRLPGSGSGRWTMARAGVRSPTRTTPELSGRRSRCCVVRPRRFPRCPPGAVRGWRRRRSRPPPGVRRRWCRRAPGSPTSDPGRCGSRPARVLRRPDQLQHRRPSGWPRADSPPVPAPRSAGVAPPTRRSTPGGGRRRRSPRGASPTPEPAPGPSGRRAATPRRSRPVDRRSAGRSAASGRPGRRGSRRGPRRRSWPARCAAVVRAAVRAGRRAPGVCSSVPVAVDRCRWRSRRSP